MAEEKVEDLTVVRSGDRVVLLAVDNSEHAEYAFACKSHLPKFNCFIIYFSGSLA